MGFGRGSCAHAEALVLAQSMFTRAHPGCSHFLFDPPEPSAGNGCDYVISSSDDICECAPSSGSSVVCDTSLWTSVDNDVTCGGCKALVEIEAYGTCNAYCAAQQNGLECVGSYTDIDDTCLTPGESEGSCRMAFVEADDCGASGFQDSLFSFYKLDDTAAPDPTWESRPGVWNSSDPVPFRICLVEEAVGGGVSSSTDRFRFTGVRRTLKMLKDAGFEPTRVCGSFGGEPLRPWSRRLVAVAQRS